MAKIKNYNGRTGMELSYVAVQATKPKKKAWNWAVVLMMLGAALAVQVL